MNRFDQAIFDGEMPTPPTTDEQPDAPGHSYYWDERARGLTHVAAVKCAQRAMGVAIGSLQRVEKYR